MSYFKRAWSTLDPGGELVRHEESGVITALPLEELLQLQDEAANNTEAALERQSPLFVAGDIHFSQLGVIGFVLVDARPEDRFMDYEDTESRVYHRTYEPPDYYDRNWENPAFVSRHHKTSEGLKALRFYMLPKSVASFLKDRPRLQAAILEECLSGVDIPVPDDYYEQAMSVHNVFCSPGSGYEDEQQLQLGQQKVRALGDILALLDPSTDRAAFRLFDGDLSWNLLPIDRHSPYSYSAYMSFHPWREQARALPVLETAVTASLELVDTTIKQFDRNGVVLAQTQETWRDGAGSIPAVQQLLGRSVLALEQGLPPEERS